MDIYKPKKKVNHLPLSLLSLSILDGISPAEMTAMKLFLF
jgi:hypothetical protein